MSIPASITGNYLLVTGSGSSQNISFTGNAQFGKIIQGFAGFDDYALNTYILFKITENSIGLTYNSQNYFLVPEQDIILIENTVSS